MGKKSLLLPACLLAVALSGCFSVKKTPLERPEPMPQPVPSSAAPSVPQTGPQLLDAPQQRASLAEVDELTVSVTATSSLGTQRSITYCIRKEEGRTVFYERNADAKEDHCYEFLCIAEGDRVRSYGDSTGDGSGFQEMPLSDLPGDAYFQCELANLGLDYDRWLTTDGFQRGEEVTWSGRACTVYDTAFTDRLGAAYYAQVTVDLQTGLWVRSVRTDPTTGAVFTIEVTEIREDAQMIPELDDLL